ncbi:MAG: HD domain-containing protein [Patescibacteria group bacterium]|nr:HD domain-containing protein [Patescibacteria group bacterium]
MTKLQKIKQTAEYIRKLSINENSGHDWWHIYRTWQLAKQIGKAEKADMFVAEMAVLLHDLGDYKLEPNHKDRTAEKVKKWLDKMDVFGSDKEKILHIVTHMSYNKNVLKTQELSLEGKIAQDADRLDAIGAMGIARCFIYTGANGAVMYDPGMKPRSFKSSEDYQQRHSIGVQHFYEKLLLLKDLMNTKTAKKIALRRHKFMEQYLKQFFAEWVGKC